MPNTFAALLNDNLRQMQKKISVMVLIMMLAGPSTTKAQTAQPDSTQKKWFVGSTLYLLGNFAKEHNPEYVQLNAGYRITPQDVVHLRFKRSVYDWPLGTSWEKIFNGTEESFPGHARILAPTIGYQRFWWKGVYTSIYALNAFEKYYDSNKIEIGNGFTLYLDFYAGYQFKFFNNRFFFEPALGISYWPHRHNFPESFKVLESKYPNYFIQPGFDFGFNF